MMISRIAVISAGLFWAMGACAQTETSSVTVAASRTLDLPIEQISYNVQVQSAIDANLDQVLQAVQGLGITANDLTGVSSSSPALQLLPAPGLSFDLQLTWSFSLTAPFSQFQQTLAKLRAASNPTPDRRSNFTISFSIANASATQATMDQAANGALPALMADARVRAKRLADAAGLTVGVILSLSDGPTSLSANIPTQSARAGDLSIPSLVRLTTTSLGGFSSPKLIVSVTVRFARLRYN